MRRFIACRASHKLQAAAHCPQFKRNIAEKINVVSHDFVDGIALRKAIVTVLSRLFKLRLFVRLFVLLKKVNLPTQMGVGNSSVGWAYVCACACGGPCAGIGPDLSSPLQTPCNAQDLRLPPCRRLTTARSGRPPRLPRPWHPLTSDCALALAASQGEGGVVPSRTMKGGLGDMHSVLWWESGWAMGGGCNSGRHLWGQSTAHGMQMD